MAAHVVLPWVHRVFANLKTWALGVYHGLRRPHLQADLDMLIAPEARASASRANILGHPRGIANLAFVSGKLRN